MYNSKGQGRGRTGSILGPSFLVATGVMGQLTMGKKAKDNKLLYFKSPKLEAIERRTQENKV